MNVSEFIINHRLCLTFILSLILIYLWIKKPKWEVSALVFILVLGTLIQTRFGQFHIPINPYSKPNEVTLIHVPDTMVYQMGSKYFEQTGYKNFYLAIAQALKELNSEDSVKYDPMVVRDLSSKTSPLLKPDNLSIENVKNHFSQKDWDNFKNDIANWEKQYNPYWSAILSDYGYNASPFTSLLGKIINLIIPTEKLYLFYLVDLILITSTLIALYWGFGLKPTLYTLAILLIFPSGFFTISDWIGSFLRCSWVLWLSLGISLLNKRHFALAGFFLALSSLERIFPLVLLLSCGLFILMGKNTPNNLKFKNLWNFVLGIVIGVIGIFSLTIYTYGLECWYDFSQFILSHSNLLAWNHFGWKKALAFHHGLISMEFGTPSSKTFELWGNYLSQRADWVFYRLIQIMLLALTFIWTIKKANNIFGASVLAGVVFFLFSTPAHYYFIFFLPVLITGVHTYNDPTKRTQPSPFTCILLILPLLILSNNFGQVGSWTIFSLILITFLVATLTCSLLNLKPKYGIVVSLSFLIVFLLYPTLTVFKENTTQLISGNIERNLLSKSGTTSRFNFKSLKDKDFFLFNLNKESDIELHFESTTWGRLAILNQGGKIVWIHELPEAPNIANSSTTRLSKGKYKLYWFSDQQSNIYIGAKLLKKS